MSYFVGGIGQDFIPTMSQIYFMDEELKKRATQEEKDMLIQSSRFLNQKNDKFGMASVGIDTYEQVTRPSIKSSRVKEEKENICRYVPPHFDNRLRKQMVRGGGIYPPIREHYLDFPNMQSRRSPMSLPSNCAYKDVYYNSPAQLPGEKLGVYFP